ncbi:hypothetical protein [Rothia terrae]|uniref:Uncharacterized protein n=1 Tax=Rothia terrae TaxID=396015 RepID=A0A7H2BGE8_9MICC|nr:hypothetical protein [Rothia terrae]QNV38744.1 hypothetical protein IDM49_05755 [Rothia terrae]
MTYKYRDPKRAGNNPTTVDSQRVMVLEKKLEVSAANYAGMRKVAERLERERDKARDERDSVQLKLNTVLDSRDLAIGKEKDKLKEERKRGKARLEEQANTLRAAYQGRIDELEKKVAEYENPAHAGKLDAEAVNALEQIIDERDARIIDLEQQLQSFMSIQDSVVFEGTLETAQLFGGSIIDLTPGVLADLGGKRLRLVVTAP